MLIKRKILDGIAAGRIDLAFRRWRRPTVRAGGTLRTGAGLLAILSVDVVPPKSITAAEARRAGYGSPAELLADLRPGSEPIYRIRLRRAGADPREALRRETKLDAAAFDALLGRLARLDAAGAHGPWTHRVLGLIAERPAVRAGDLAHRLGRERLAFKADVRKLKNLGLTESLEVGYRLSPRGKAVLRRLDRR